MEGEIFIRKHAVKLYLKGVPITKISKKLNRSRQWVHKWITRYRKGGDNEWFLSKSTIPKHVPNKVDHDLEDLVVKIRKTLEGRQYSQIGAINIMYEIEKIGIKRIPSVMSILQG